jgi:hypothetical protein
MILDLKIKSKKQNENNHHKFCSIYVQLSRLRIFFELHILEFFIMNDFKHRLNFELMIEMKKLQILQKKKSLKIERWKYDNVLTIFVK